VLGLVAFSFGQREDEKNDPCLSNIDLAEAVGKIVSCEAEKIVVVAQWEIAKVLLQSASVNEQMEWLEPDFIVHHHRVEGEYLDSDEVMAQAALYLHKRGVTAVIPVAHPFLHLTKCKQLVREAGFALAERKIGRVRFDKLSVQPWTRGRAPLLVYALKQKFTGHRGD
jgi:hypothetical protein